MVEWGKGDTTTEPLYNIASDDTVTHAMYDGDKNLL